MKLTKEFVKSCNKPNSDGLYDLPPESGEYVILYDWNELCHGSNVIQWRELPHPKE